MATSLLPDLLMMEFANRLLKLRKDKGLTQQALADMAGLHVVQVRRYETNSSQPSLEAIRKLAIALSVSADALLFDEAERGPDEDLKMEFEALNQFDAEEKAIAKKVLQGLIIQHQAKRWTSAASG